MPVVASRSSYIYTSWLELPTRTSCVRQGEVPRHRLSLLFVNLHYLKNKKSNLIAPLQDGVSLKVAHLFNTQENNVNANNLD